MAKFETIDAIGIEWHTLVGINTDSYPVLFGNCFGVVTYDNKHFSIVNFILENLEEVIRRGVNFPIKIHPIGEKHAVIHDERILDNWYRDRWCSLCCPSNLLPVQQKLEHDRQEKQGYRTASENNSVWYDPKKRPNL